MKWFLFSLQTDTHYGLISLLLRLADNPTQSIYDGLSLKLKEEGTKSFKGRIHPIGDVMVSHLSSSTIDRGLNLGQVRSWFEPWSGQVEGHKMGISCFFSKYTALRRKSKDGLSQNQNKLSKWSGMSTGRLLFQWSIAKRTSSSSDRNLTCSNHDTAKKLLIGIEQQRLIYSNNGQHHKSDLPNRFRTVWLIFTYKLMWNHIRQIISVISSVSSNQKHFYRSPTMKNV